MRKLADSATLCCTSVHTTGAHDRTLEPRIRDALFAALVSIAVVADVIAVGGE
ncbi:hypothetical protein AS9A_1613 [Hoyosella subflava DQS3-9A1]|uniref:Uncharacterized protein n=1 Tax=Hoyosella subflava (strain DSM 45089 / JCM 17490 / NBRC 109087 / DQS3-9A1) TaxID=443218 RepID=F6EJ01_HOYSD|nr:hypothetical protein AS9A_1613 [Hoyosella subflava DQS3-9A1]